jgi:hypothetical protein
MADRSLDSLAVRMSRKFDPGYDEKREKEIAELIETMQVMEMIEEEIEIRKAELESGDDDQE